MSTATEPRTRGDALTRRRLWRAVSRSELTKLLTLRTTLITAVATPLAVIALAWGVTAAVAGAPAEGPSTGLVPGSAFLLALDFGQFGVILLATWAALQQTDKPTLRTTLLATPQRLLVLFAALWVLVVLVAAGAALAAAGSAGVRCLAIDCGTVDAAFAPDAGTAWRMAAGLVAFWVGMAATTYATAIATRAPLAVMGVMLALTAGLSDLLLNATDAARFLPDQAGSLLYQPGPLAAGSLTPTSGGLVLAGWTALAITAAAWSIHRRDVG